MELLWYAQVKNDRDKSDGKRYFVVCRRETGITFACFYIPSEQLKKWEERMGELLLSQARECLHPSVDKIHNTSRYIVLCRQYSFDKQVPKKYLREIQKSLALENL